MLRVFEADAAEFLVSVAFFDDQVKDAIRILDPCECDGTGTDLPIFAYGLINSMDTIQQPEPYVG
jgi:hypothetical protein